MSLFSQTLKRLLDETNLFTRPDWAEFLGVEEETIEEWLLDRRMPLAEYLSLMLDTLHGCTGVPEEPLAAFEGIADRPATEVSPHARFIGDTLRQYMEETLDERHSRIPEARGESFLDALTGGGWTLPT